MRVLYVMAWNSRIFSVWFRIALATQMFVSMSGDQLLLGQTVDNQTRLPFDLFSKEFDWLFPPEMPFWASQTSQIAHGLEEAEKLREKVKSRNSDGVSNAVLLCEKFAAFKNGAASKLSNGKAVASFEMTSDRLMRQLDGEVELSADAFAAFDGRWFGRWADSEVNHDWQPVERYSPQKKIDGIKPRIDALQYAWISNGFGWNYLVTNPNALIKEAGTKPYVLGMVYYFDGVDFKTIRGEKAHVGFAESPTRLVWITANEVFLEEVFPAVDPAKTIYAITAMYHDLLSNQPSVSKRGTQAVYTRSPQSRPAFRVFEWK